MAHEQTTRRFRKAYAALLRLYPRPYRERFAEPMEQTFNDLVRARAVDRRGLVGFVLWMFIETFAGILRENARAVMMQTITRRLVVWAAAVASFLLIPLALTLVGSGTDGRGFHWTPIDFVAAFMLLFGAGAAYELVSSRTGNRMYRVAVGIAVTASLLLVWITAAVGEPGDSPGPLLLAVVATLVIGALITGFQPQGMAYALFATALAQVSVALIAVIAWGQHVEILAFNGFFALLWITSALLFRRAALERTAPIA